MKEKQRVNKRLRIKSTAQISQLNQWQLESITRRARCWDGGRLSKNKIISYNRASIKELILISMLRTSCKMGAEGMTPSNSSRDHLSWVRVRIHRKLIRSVTKFTIIRPAQPTIRVALPCRQYRYRWGQTCSLFTRILKKKTLNLIKWAVDRMICS